jgi:hypothetical protein
MSRRRNTLVVPLRLGQGDPANAGRPTTVDGFARGSICFPWHLKAGCLALRAPILKCSAAWSFRRHQRESGPGVAILKAAQEERGSRACGAFIGSGATSRVRLYYSAEPAAAGRSPGGFPGTFLLQTYLMMNGFEVSGAVEIQTDLTWRYSLMASIPLSLPRPLRLYPPKGEVKLTAR